MSGEAWVDIVFDGPPGPECGRFVEVENAKRASIRLGEWVQRDDGYWVLRINPDGLLERAMDAYCRMMNRLCGSESYQPQDTEDRAAVRAALAAALWGQSEMTDGGGQ